MHHLGVHLPSPHRYSGLRPATEVAGYPCEACLRRLGPSPPSRVGTQSAEKGQRELCRVALRRAVLLTWDPSFAHGFWLVRDYLPEILALEVPSFRPVRQIVMALGGGLVQTVPIPHDCTDGFFGAYWRRPEAYLEPQVRAGISTFARLGKAVLQHGLQCLADDLRSGAWERANGHLRRLETLDLGYRLVMHTNLEPRNSTA